jgi:fatty-acyl-CoA synthase
MCRCRSTAFAGRAGTLFKRNEIVSRLPDKTLRTAHLWRVAPAHARVGRRAEGLGLRKGDRVATLCWNHHAHLEATSASRRPAA